MKTKYLLIVFLFLGITLNQLSAQNNPKDEINKSFVIRGTNASYVIHVYCNGVLVDDLACEHPVHNVDHYQEGFLVWRISRNIGKATSLLTGEIFQLKDIDRITITDDESLEGFAIEHTNVIGDKGSHYIFTYIYKFPAWELTSVVKAICPGSKE